jgi:hypothetical protein
MSKSISIVTKVAIVALILAIVAYFIISRNKPKDVYVIDEPGGGGGGGQNKLDCQSKKDIDRDKILFRNMEPNCEVWYLQGWLNGYYQKGLKQDGVFGPLTEKALMEVKGVKGGTLNGLSI